VDGSTGISISPTLNITVSDSDKDVMNITWYSNSSGSWQIFGTNIRVTNGGYQSKIENTGSTRIKGYLLIQVQYYNTSNTTWVVVDDTVNESSPRTIKWDDPAGQEGQNILALDTIFNGLVNTNDLSEFGDGTYRIYAAFRDPDGDVLVCDDDSLLEAWWEFTVDTT